MAAQPTILVADDQATYRELIARRLRGAGYRVLLASDGQAAVELSRTEKPDAILLDRAMPILDGLDACRQIRAMEGVPHVPIMIVSQTARPDDRVAGLRAGAEDYLGKPFDNDELLARVEVLLRLRRLIGERQRPGPTEPALASAASRDPLSGLWSYSHFEERLENELERAKRYNEPIALMLIDIDNMGSDTTTREECMMAAAAAVGRCTRAADIAARGKETTFSIILPKTNFAGAVAAADRMWRELAGTFLPETNDRRSASLRSSLGVACFPTREAQTAKELTAFAHTALERARAEGPAHICLVQHQAYIFRPE